MLDRWFMSKMSQRGKIFYFVGQLALIAAWALILFPVILVMGFVERALPVGRPQATPIALPTVTAISPKLPTVAA